MTHHQHTTNNHPIYPVQEDSEFLATFVEQHAHGATLDMGTGSGIQAMSAAHNTKVTSVLAVDTNVVAINELQEKLRLTKDPDYQKITPAHSDLFSNIKGQQFDTIICNPPYLPDEKEEDKVHDIALHGGPGGYEWVVRFLTESTSHIAPNGQILLLFSSLSNKERIDQELRRLHYHHETLGELYVGMFEHLYVCRIWR